MLTAYMGSNRDGQTNNMETISCYWMRRLLLVREFVVPQLTVGKISGKYLYAHAEFSFSFLARGCWWRENAGLPGPLVWASVLCFKDDNFLVSIFSVLCSGCSRPLQDSWSISRSIHLTETVNTQHRRTDCHGLLFWLQQKLSKLKMFLR